MNSVKVFTRSLFIHWTYHTIIYGDISPPGIFPHFKCFSPARILLRFVLLLKQLPTTHSYSDETWFLRYKPALKKNQTPGFCTISAPIGANIVIRSKRCRLYCLYNTQSIFYNIHIYADRRCVCTGSGLAPRVVSRIWSFCSVNKIETLHRTYINLYKYLHTIFDWI